MKAILSLLFVLVIITNSNAQEYLTEGRNRLNFAKTYVELGGQYSPSFTGKALSTNNAVQTFQNSASTTPYFNIGAFHFWGHAEFFLSIPFSQYNLKKNDSTNHILNQSASTGARFFPWAYKDKKIRPYIGASWVNLSFKQENKINNEQPLYRKSKIIFDAGFLYGKGSFMTRLGINLYPSNNLNYPISKNNFQQIKTPNWGAYLGLIYAFETTRSKNMEAENARLNKYPNTSSPTLNAIKKGDWFIGVGPSVSFMLGTSNYNTETHPYFNKKPISNGFLDISLGYHFNRAGIVTALSYRNPKFTNEAFGITQTIKKNSIVLEAYKYLTDYSGFTPYIGLNIAVNDINYTEKSNTKHLSSTTSIVTPGITFGWDILPGKTEQWAVLRTNLRWFPFEKLNVTNKIFSLNQIEYNVIQLVIYPSRFKNAKSKKD